MNMLAIALLAAGLSDPVPGRIESREYVFEDTSFMSAEVTGDSARQMYEFLKQRTAEWWCPEAPETKFVHAASIRCTNDRNLRWSCGILIGEDGFVSGDYMACPAPSIGVRD